HQSRLRPGSFSQPHSCVDSARKSPPAFMISIMDLTQNGTRIKFHLIARIVRLEFANVTDPPDMIAHAVLGHIFPIHPAPRDVLAHRNGFQHGAIRKPAAADVINLARSRSLKEPIESLYQIRTVQIVADLLAL